MGKLKNAIKNLGSKINGVEPIGYYTTELLKSFGETLTGKDIEGKNITDILNGIANNYDATKDLINLVAYTSDDVLGKATSDLQSNLVVSGNAIKGTSKYVTGYTGFSSKTSEQKGNFIALYTPMVEGLSVTMELVGGTSGPKPLDDGIIVLRITDKDAQSLKLTATDGTNTIVKEYSLSGLTLANE